jgi:hypothetical protein
LQRKPLVAATVAALTSAAVFGGVSMAAGGSSTGRSLTFHLVEKGVGFHYVDVPPTATERNQISSQGDMFVIASDLYTAAGKRAGSLDAYCTVTRGGRDETSVCTGTFRLAGGQLDAMVTMRGQGNVSRIPIIGGSGVYRGATGEIVSAGSQNSNISHDVVHIQLPS